MNYTVDMIDKTVANMRLWTPFPFRLPNSTKVMDIRRFLPSKNIRILEKDTITRKNCFNLDSRR